VSILSRSNIIVLLLGLAILVAILGSLYFETGPIYGELKNLNLIPVPERFTELYFQDPATLPNSVAKGKTLSFSFVIHNVEGATTTYPYVAYFESSDNTKSVLQNGNVSLSDNESTTIAVAHTFAAAAGTGTIVVDLPTLSQQIDFLL